MNEDSIPIVDSHIHFLDAGLHTYPIFPQRNPGFEALVGDYSALPRRYLPEHYLKDISGFDVTKTVWAEFMSSDPIREVRWAENLSEAADHPHGIIAQVDFLNPDIERVLNVYASLRHVGTVRQHLAWHPSNPLMRYAPRSDVLSDKAWQERLALLRKYHIRCEIELFALQLPELTAVVSSYSDIQFILPLMGWPIDLTKAGHRDWKRDLKTIAGCENVAVKIFGVECIFGLDWTVDRIRPWILDAIECFRPERSMFGSHMPIAKLSRNFQDLYRAYFDIVSGFSASEKRKLFAETATAIYGLASSDHSQ